MVGSVGAFARVLRAVSINLTGGYEMMTWTSDDGDCQISIAFDRHDHGRVQYRWTVSADGRVYTASDLRSGSGQDVSEVSMFPALADFLVAFTEAHRYGSESSENWDLFNPEMADIAVGYSDEFYSAFDESE